VVESGPVVFALLLAGSALAGAQGAPSPSPSPSPSASSASPLRTPSPSPRPVSESVDRVVDRMEKQREDPCVEAKAEGRPCFPVTTTIKGEEYSVRKSLGLPDDKKDKPAAGTPPTTAEMKDYRPGPEAEVVPLFSFDPGCVAKGILKSLKGKNDTYYLYRVRDVHGERVALYDRKLDAETFQGELAFLGRFDGECDALAAYRREERRLAPKGPPPPGPRPSPSASPP
jgi:hypothetical protein